jgi:hypothetical protein
MSIQTLEQFQTSFGSKPIEVTLEKFGKDAVFYLKPLISADRDNFEASVVGIDGKRNLTNLRARLVSLCWCDKTGKQVGTPKEIGALRADLVGALFDEIRTLNGMDADDAVEEAGKD